MKYLLLPCARAAGAVPDPGRHRGVSLEGTHRRRDGPAGNLGPVRELPRTAELTVG